MKILTIIAFTLITISSCKTTYESTDNLLSELPNGALLVRLESKQKSITALRAKNSPIADKVETKQKEKNQKIINAFEENFTLCPVFYFYDYQSSEIKKKKFEGQLLNAKLESVKNIPFLEDNFLIAEFSFTQGDSTHLNAEIHTLDKDGKTISSVDTSYVMYEGFSFDALVLLSPDLYLLEDPYPHYIRKNVIVFRRSEKEMVHKMENKIIKYRTQNNL